MRRLALALALLAAPAAATDLTVQVLGVSAAPGAILVAACPREGFPGAACPFLGSAPAHAGEVTITLKDLPAGEFALKAFHDLDGDRTLRTDWLGRPQEPLGFGNDAPITRFGPPRFEAAAIRLPATGAFETRLRLRYE
jgi:uncharacterized protein (DUF2141 family)